MNEFSALRAPVQALDHNAVDPMPTILNQQQHIKVARPIPIPLPGRFFEQNAGLPRTGTKQSKQTDISKSLTTDATAPTEAGMASPFPASPGGAAIEPAKRQKRQRVLVDMHNEHDMEGDGDDQGVIENAYERERLERIKRNQEVMRQMGLRQLAVGTAAIAKLNSDTGAGGINQSSKPRRRAGPKKGKFSAAQTGPCRSSARNRHQAGEHLEKTDRNRLLQDGGDDALESLDTEDSLLNLEEYFNVYNINVSNAIKVDGHYRGWVSKNVAETYGLPLEYPGDDWLRSAPPSTSTAAGERGKRGRKKGGRGGVSNAKAKSSASLLYNPNSYFYRHVAPHQRQAQGEWTREEHDKFMEVVREWGVGDNWGLFASHICQRVGYQCSAFYRDVIIPSGAVIDDRFQMTRTGKAVFVR